MNRLIQSLKNLVHSEQPRFILICLRIGTAFLFFLSTLFSFTKMIQFGNVVSRVSAAQIGWVFVLATWALMMSYLWTELDEKKPLQKPALIIQSAQASILWIWGLLVHLALVEEAKSYPEASAVLGFGFWFMLIGIGLLWFTALGEKYLNPMICKWVPFQPKPMPSEFPNEEKPTEPVEQSTPEPQPESSVTDVGSEEKKTE